MTAVDGPCQVEVEQTAWACRTCARGKEGYSDRDSAAQAARAHVEQIGMTQAQLYDTGRRL